VRYDLHQNEDGSSVVITGADAVDSHKPPNVMRDSTEEYY
jgi:hypothetical protein